MAERLTNAQELVVPCFKFLTRHLPAQSPQKASVEVQGLARPGRKQATATEDFDVHMSYLLS